VRRLFGSVLMAGALAAVAAAPAAAELEICILDPSVVVDGTTLQVGLYTHDPSLVAAGGIPASVPIDVLLDGSRGSHVSSDAAQWSAVRPTDLTIFEALPGAGHGAKQTIEIDALVPSTLVHDSFYIKVQLPDGSVKTASGPVNSLVRLRVQVPVAR
jgi:hypothetical protein